MMFFRKKKFPEPDKNSKYWLETVKDYDQIKDSHQELYSTFFNEEINPEYRFIFVTLDEMNALFGEDNKLRKGTIDGVDIHYSKIPERVAVYNAFLIKELNKFHTLVNLFHATGHMDYRSKNNLLYIPEELELISETSAFFYEFIAKCSSFVGKPSKLIERIDFEPGDKLHEKAREYAGILFNEEFEDKHIDTDETVLEIIRDTRKRLFACESEYDLINLVFNEIGESKEDALNKELKKLERRNGKKLKKRLKAAKAITKTTNLAGE